MLGFSSKVTTSPFPTAPPLQLYRQLTTPQQLRCRRWSSHSQHRCLPDHCPDRSDLSRALWPQQDRHQPPPENDPHLGCGDDTAGARGRAPGGEIARYGESAAGGGNGRCDQHGHCLCGRAVEESRGANQDGTEDERHRAGIREGTNRGSADVGGYVMQVVSGPHAANTL